MNRNDDFRLKLSVNIANKKTVLQPSFFEVQRHIIGLIEKIIELASSVPTMETKLFAEWSEPQEKIQVSFCSIDIFKV